MTNTMATDASTDATPQPVDPGDPRLLENPVAQQLLHATLPARLAYVGPDGRPRIIAALYHWTGAELVVTSWPDDPKVAALQARPEVAVTIDTADFPFKVLSLRGTATVDIVDGVAPECLPICTRYFGPEGGQAWVERMRHMCDQQARIAIRPTWINVLDFEIRFPQGMTRRMRAA